MRIKTILFVCLFSITYANELIASQYASNTTLHLANTFHNRAEQWYFENFDSCAFYLEKALPLFKKIKKWDAYVDCINGLFAISYQKRDFEKAERFAYKANEEAYKYLENRSEVYNSAINSLGAIYYEKRFIKKAISNYEVALYNELSRSTRNNALLASIYHNISNAQITLGDYEAALQNLFQAVSLRKNLLQPDVIEIAQTYKTIGFCLTKMFKFSEASIYYHKSLVIYNAQREGGDYLLNERFNILQSLAQVYLDNNNLDSCKYILNKLRANFLSDEKVKSKFPTYETLGHLYLKLGRTELSKGFYEKAIDQAIIEHKEFECHPNIARSISNLGSFYLEIKDYKKAVSYYQKALTKLVFDFQPNFLHQNPSTKTFLSTIEGIQILHGKARALFLYHEQSHSARVLHAALKTYQVADSLISKTRENIFSIGSKQQLAGQLNAVYEDAIHTALNMYQLTKERRYLAIAFSFAESNKAILLLESIQEGLARNFGGLPQKLQAKERSIRMNIVFCEQLINEQKQKGLGADYQKINTWTKQLFQLNKEYHKLDHILESKYPEYKQLKHAKTLASVQDIQQQLQTSDALLEYFWGETTIFLFLITKNKMEIIRIPKSVDMDKAIRQLTDYLQHRNQPKVPPYNFTRLAYQCFQFFMQPAIDKIPISINRLIIIPDDLLAYIPFEILLSKRIAKVKQHFNWSKLDYLLKKFAINYSYSSTLFLNSLKSRKRRYKHTFLGLAPSFQSSFQFREVRNCASNQLYALHCAGKEVLAIKDLLGGKAILKESANLERFKVIAADFQVLHLATHACSNHQNPKFSKIYFAQEALATNDLSTLYLPSELAVLSACNTGSGKLIKGEGVMSLSTGFISAGCPSTVMSLWSLDDCATLDLMLLFYSYLKKGLAKDQALRKAKLDFIANSDKVHQQPYYWAAFVQMGNYQPLNLNEPASNKIRFLVLFFVFISIPFVHSLLKKRG